MSLNIPDHYTISFSTNVVLLLQQKGSKLRDKVTIGQYTGEQASPVDQIGPVELQDVTGRFQPKVRTDAAVDRRWVFPSDFDLTQSIDSFDKLRLITDPESSYTQNAVLGAGRKMDRLIILAFTGTAKTGKQGATSTSFTAGNEVDVAVGGANSRLNVDKLLEVKEKMRANHVDFDLEEIYLGLTAKDESELLKQIQIISSDFNRQDKPVMQDGKVSRFLGIEIVYCELIESVATGTNEVNVPVWCKSGMHLGIWNDVYTSAYKNMQLKGEPLELYLMMTMGATRIEEGRVYNIESYRA
jgi:capsid protein